MPLRLLVVITYWMPILPAMAENRVPVAFSEDLAPHWFAGRAGDHIAVPGAGQILACGELSLGQDSIADVAQVHMVFPDGSHHAVQIDRSSVVYEFGRLAFCRYAIAIPASLIGQDGFVLAYGADVHAQNELSGRLVLDRTKPALYREMVYVVSSSQNAESEAQDMNLKVIVDRHRSHYQWLYLLPAILVLGALLPGVARKRRKSA